MCTSAISPVPLRSVCPLSDLSEFSTILKVWLTGHTKTFLYLSVFQTDLLIHIVLNLIDLGKDFKVLPSLKIEKLTEHLEGLKN